MLELLSFSISFTMTNEDSISVLLISEVCASGSPSSLLDAASAVYFWIVGELSAALGRCIKGIASQLGLLSVVVSEPSSRPSLANGVNEGSILASSSTRANSSLTVFWSCKTPEDCESFVFVLSVLSPSRCTLLSFTTTNEESPSVPLISAYFSLVISTKDKEHGPCSVCTTAKEESADEITLGSEGAADAT